LQLLQEGKRATLYEYVVSGVNTGEDFYTFEKPDSSILFSKSYDALSTFREKLITFYGENAAITDLIQKKFNSRWKIQTDIAEIMDSINKL
jgi:hypothetical protein